MSEQNYRAKVEHHCDGCRCHPPTRPAAEEIVQAMTESPARDETQHHPT
jgi:hypothetical protein